MRTGFAALCWLSTFAAASAGWAQSPPVSSADAKPAEQVYAISGNPAASTSTIGTGYFGRLLGLKDEWGVRLGGMWLADVNLVAAGGRDPGGTTANSALFISLGIDAEKLVDWRGASFGFQFLQVNASNTNGEAGSVIGYNSIVGLRPFNRSELFEAFYEQELVKDIFKFRVGRSLPTLDFNNVSRPLQLAEPGMNIPSVSGLLYTPIFINGTLLGVLPGYYNPGDGVTVNFTPTKNFYLNLGAYDGNAPNGIQSGLYPPRLDGYYFTIGEIGTNWLLGEGRYPGQFGIGLWRQTGLLTARGVSESGAGGAYFFGSQQVARGLNSSVEHSSVSVFYQFGVNDSQTLPINQFYGAGITGFGLIGNRDRDSMGAGFALSRLNHNLFQRPSELMFQAYYQAHVVAAIFLQPTITYIPTPGIGATTPGALTTTLRLAVLF